MLLGSNLTPEQILHELKCSKKIKELYSLKDGAVKWFLFIGAVVGVHRGTLRALKGQTNKVRERSSLLTVFLTVASIEPCWFHVSVFFQIIISNH